jgi:hypothetical protein
VIAKDFVYAFCSHTKPLAEGRSLSDGDPFHTTLFEQKDHVMDESGGGVDAIERSLVVV